MFRIPSLAPSPSITCVGDPGFASHRPSRRPENPSFFAPAAAENAQIHVHHQGRIRTGVAVVHLGRHYQSSDSLGVVSIYFAIWPSRGRLSRDRIRSVLRRSGNRRTAVAALKYSISTRSFNTRMLRPLTRRPKYSTRSLPVSPCRSRNTSHFSPRLRAPRVLSATFNCALPRAVIGYQHPILCIRNGLAMPPLVPAFVTSRKMNNK